MKKYLHRNVLSYAASPLKLSELESSKKICYQVVASPLNKCTLLLAEMITINKLSHKLNVSLHKTSAQALLSLCNRPHLKVTSPLPLMSKCKIINVPPLLDAPLLHVKCSLTEMEAMAPWKYSPCKFKPNTSFSSSSQGFCSNPHEVRPPSLQEMHPSSLLQNSQVKNESPKLTLLSLWPL
jgi:hypothetical protein